MRDVIYTDDILSQDDKSSENTYDGLIKVEPYIPCLDGSFKRVKIN